MKRRPLTVGAAMAAIALAAAVLGLVASERWRWGYPLGVRFDDQTALKGMGRVCRDDFRKYDGLDVAGLMDHIVQKRLLIGMSSGRVIELMGPPLIGSVVSRGVSFSAGTIPDGWHAELAMLCCRCDEAGLCVEVVALSSG